MDIIKKLVEKLTDKDKHGIYLREIALLMEENEELKDRVREKEKEIKNLIKHVKGKSDAE